jgi:methionyl-tRNA formyltransferase
MPITKNLVLFTKPSLIYRLVDVFRQCGIAQNLDSIVLSDHEFEITGLRTTSNSVENLGIKILSHSDFKKICHELEEIYLCGISFMYSEKFDNQDLQFFSKGIINFHPSLLPINKGSDTVSWAILNGTKHGVTAHLVNTKIDDGPIISQKEIKYNFEHTAEKLYQQTISELLNLLSESIQKWLDNKLKPYAQEGPGSFHNKNEITKIKEVSIDDLSNARILLDFLRAASFSPSDGLRLKLDGKFYHLYLKIEELNEH